jgi:glucosamine-6-phosphate deaminase
VTLAPQLPDWDSVDLVNAMQFLEDCPIRVDNEVHLAEGRKPALVVPAGPMPQYYPDARIINERHISVPDVTFFAMDEWAIELGESAPGSWEGSFQFPLRSQFFDCIDSELLPPQTQHNFPSSATIDDYGKRSADAGGADACFGGIGLNRHIAFWKPHLGHEFGGNRAAYRTTRSLLVNLHPLTGAQNAFTSFAGDWSNVLPRPVRIGPAEILGPNVAAFGSTAISGQA